MKKTRPVLTLVRRDASIVAHEDSEFETRDLPTKTNDEQGLEEVDVRELRAGDVIRVRLYEGLPGRLFASPSQTLSGDAQDLQIARIENATRRGAYFGPIPVRIAMSFCGRCVTLDQEDYFCVTRASAEPLTVEFRDVTPPRMLPAPNPLHEIIDAEFYDPNDDGGCDAGE